ncbi:MAG TPA: undecaprenyl-diphosphate phosphatase [Flavobacteriaceae bacterium]|nr:undecaprenyl-diphosphate phosphatase [Flavobacteriaceae bacterium]
MNTIEAIVLAIVEGLTEYLPVSSTGHMIIVSSFFGIADEAFTKLFTVAIQFGTILSVLVLYWKRFVQSVDFYKKLFVAFLPAVVLGLIFSDLIDELLESPLVVAISLILGGFVLLKVDDWFKASKEEKITYLTALKIGFFQCIAMIPGVSRSGASIVGGMSQKLSRTTAAEFSFFLAVPTMFGAAAKKSWDYYQEGFVLNAEQINLLLIGNIIGFLVAILAIKSFIGYLSKHGFKLFGYYRIVIGVAILAIHYFVQPLTV